MRPGGATRDIGLFADEVGLPVASPAFAAFTGRLDPQETKDFLQTGHSLQRQRTRERPCDPALVLLLLVEVVVVVVLTLANLLLLSCIVRKKAGIGAPLTVPSKNS